ncbi:50S ribosomal protein L29 [Candidatus Woesearchaeota archaeon]|nr:50S ribosomal protein L29 [Candidatus Woesearchaeota archaeon]
MKNLKNKELAQLSTGELSSKLGEVRKEIMKDNAQVAMRTIPKNPGLLRTNKKMVARILGLLNKKISGTKKDKKSISGMKHKEE